MRKSQIIQFHTASVTLLLWFVCLLHQPTSIQCFSLQSQPLSTIFRSREGHAFTFQRTTSSYQQRQQYLPFSRHGVKLDLFRKIFRRNKSDDENDKIDDDIDSSSNEVVVEEKEKSKETFFFASNNNDNNGDDNNEDKNKEAETKQVETETITTKPIPKQLTPLEQAEMLRAQAERTRLEAEKMDIVLTLEKIEKLEMELEKLSSSGDDATTSTTNGDVETDTKKEKSSGSSGKNREELIQQIQTLKKKLNGDNEVEKNDTEGKEPKKDSSDSLKTTSLSSSSSSSSSSTNEQPIQQRTNVNSVIESIIEEATTTATASTTTAAGSTNHTTTSIDDTINLSNEELERRIQNFNDAPRFMKELVVNTVGGGGESLPKLDDEAFNVTELILQMEKDNMKYANQLQQLNDNNGQKEMPTFTQEQIDEVVEAVKLVPQFVKNMYGDEIKNNDTAIALLMLEDEWQSGKIVPMPEITQEMIDRKLEDVKWVPQFLRGDNDTELALELIKMDFRNNPRKFREEVLGEKSGSSEDGVVKDGKKDDEKSEKESAMESIFGSTRLFGNKDDEKQEDDDDSNKNTMVESLFPPTTRKEGEEPTEREIKIAMTDIFAKDNTWMASGPAEKVSGGYLIRGFSSKYDSGRTLMEAIEKNLEKSNVRDQINIFYIFDPTPVTEEQMEGGERPPVLFVTGANVVRDPAPIVRSIISAVALGTVWYNAFVPYLLNDKYMKLADEQLALADASMPANLDFLSDLSTPLFFTCIGIQVIHEVAHKIVADANGIKISFPTLVPSLESGLTGAITSLQSVPKDKQALFDFAIAGPLAAILTSVIMIYAGMFLSSSMDAAAFADLPALPLALLRQSSLAGGIIDSISPGLLSIPDAALNTRALTDINIPLHPLTIAGYFGLMINAINLLPAGRTDGGRISLALFGRSGTQLVSFITYVGIFLAGIMGSDLLLFFFSYLIFFQSELEIPQQNEVDDMDFSRVLLATATGVLVLLTLIPM